MSDPSRWQWVQGVVWGLITAVQVAFCLAADEPQRPYTGHRGNVTCLQFAPDERHFLSGGEDGRVYYVDSRSWNIVHELKGHDKPVRCVQFRTDGKQFLSAGEDGVVQVFSLDEKRELARLKLEGKAIRRAAFVPNKPEVVLGTSDGTLNHWDFEQNKELRAWTGHKSGIADLAVSKDGKNLFTLDHDGVAYKWLLAEGRVVRQLTTLNEPFMKKEPLRGVRGEYTITASPKPPGFLEALFGNKTSKERYPPGVFSENGRQLLLTKVCTVEIQGRWFDPGEPADPPTRRTSTGTPFDLVVFPVFAFTDIVSSLTRSSGRAPGWRPFQKSVDAPQFLLQDPNTGTLGKRFFGGPGPSITALDLADGGNHLALGCTDGSVWVCTLSGRQATQLHPDPQAAIVNRGRGGKEALAMGLAPDSSFVTAVALNRGGKYAVAGHASGEVRLWNVYTRRIVQPAK
jgi:WD40 repeat protein